MPGKICARVIAYLLGENDYEVTENVDEIDEEKHSVPHIVVIAHSTLLQDDSSVVHDESTDDEESEIEMDLNWSN